MLSSSHLYRPAASRSWLLVRHASTSTASVTPPPSQAVVSQSAVPRRRRRQVEAEEGADLVAPPDPLSNIRPVMYGSSTSSQRPRTRTPNSPYSTGEFPGAAPPSRLRELEQQWRLRQESVDAMNHRFWAERNQEFHAQLDHRLSLLPAPSDPPSAEDQKRREDCLTQFYADWQASNRDRMGVWVTAWWREVWEGLRMQARVHRERVFGR